MDVRRGYRSRANVHDRLSWHGSNWLKADERMGGDGACDSKSGAEPLERRFDLAVMTAAAAVVTTTAPEVFFTGKFGRFAAAEGLFGLMVTAK